MKIQALRLFNVRRFADRGVAIEGMGDGVNVLSAPNEAGKSTSFEALHALFFQQHRSVANDVKSLRPYSGGHPVIEADVATERGLHRIRKQFLGGPAAARVTDLGTGRIVAQADEAENFIAALVQEGASGPAGLLWVRQGVTGLEKRSRADDAERQARAGLLESVQGEVEAVTGGRRMAEIIAKVHDDLATLVTPTGRPKTGGPYADALDDRARLTGKEQTLREKVELLRSALDGRATAQKNLDELDQPEAAAARRDAVERARQALDAAKTRAQALRAAQEHLRRVQESHDRAAADLAQFRAALEKTAALSDEAGKTALRREAAKARRETAIAAIAAAEAEAARADEEVAAARASIERIDAALRAREARKGLDALTARLEAALETRREIEGGEAAHALLKIPADAVDKVEKIGIEIARLQALKTAAQPSVQVAYETPGAPSITMDGALIGEGEARGFDGQAVLSVRGVGAITVRAGATTKSHAELGDAERKRQTLLKSLGVETLAAARARQVEAGRAEAQLDALRRRLLDLAPDGIAKLEAEVAAQREAGVEIAEAPEDMDGARTTLKAAEARRDAATDARREAEPARQAAEAALLEAEIALAKLESEREQSEAVLGPEAERAARERKLEAALAEDRNDLSQCSREVDELRAAADDLETTEAVWKRAASIADAATTTASRLREQIAELNGQIRTSADDAVEESWRETADALDAATARALDFEREVSVLRTLEAALNASREQARDIYLRPIIAELRPLLGLLFDDVAIAFDDKTLLPQTIVRNGLEEDVERLSGGMREQLSVLTRLAFARLLAKGGRPAPIILDDALIYSDDDRIERMFDALHRQAAGQQIIVFSCRRRAFAQLGGTPLLMQDWRPEG